MAVDDEDPEYVLGWATGIRAIGQVHFVFVKSFYRRQRIGETLVGALIQGVDHPTCTAMTPSGYKLSRALGLELVTWEPHVDEN